jgi:hypothetical protein
MVVYRDRNPKCFGKLATTAMTKEAKNYTDAH